MRAGWLAGAAFAAAGLAACGGGKAEGSIPRDRFVKANVELRLVPDTAAKGDSLRAAALRKYRVTEKDLRRFIQAHARRPEYLAEVWREVADSVQRKYERTLPSGAVQEPSLPPGMGVPDAGARPDSALGRQPVVIPPGGPPAPPQNLQPTSDQPDKPRPRAVPERPAPRRPPGPPPDSRRPLPPPLLDTLRRDFR